MIIYKNHLYPTRKSLKLEIGVSRFRKAYKNKELTYCELEDYEKILQAQKDNQLKSRL